MEGTGIGDRMVLIYNFLLKLHVYLAIKEINDT
jgi:hypothetical protein